MEFFGVTGEVIATWLFWLFISISIYWGYWMAKNRGSGKASAKMIKAPSIFKLGAIDMWWPNTPVRKQVLEEKVLVIMYVLLGIYVHSYFLVMLALPLLIHNEK